MKATLPLAVWRSTPTSNESPDPELAPLTPARIAGIFAVAVACAAILLLYGGHPARYLVGAQPVLDGSTNIAALVCGLVLLTYGARARSFVGILVGTAYAAEGALGYLAFVRLTSVKVAPSLAAGIGIADWVAGHLAFAACAIVATALLAMRADRASTPLVTAFVAAIVASTVAATVALVVATPPLLWHSSARVLDATGRTYATLPGEILAIVVASAVFAVAVVVWAATRRALPLYTVSFAVLASSLELLLGLLAIPDTVGWYAVKAFAAVATSALVVAFVHETTWRSTVERVVDDHAGAYARARAADQRRLIFLAFHDELTGLSNRAHWQSELHERIAANERDKRSETFSILFIDLDHFKDINDRGGHAFGDAVLVEAARRLRAALGHAASIGRLGGDEFAIICENADPQFLAARVCDAFQVTFSAQGVSADLGVTIGIARYPIDGTTAGDLLRNADQALYHAKRSGGNLYMRYDASMAEDRRKHVAVREALTSALANHELSLAFQPIFDIATRRCESVEALLRWNSASLGRVSPGVFIPIAENGDAMREIGRFTLDRAVDALARWHGKPGSAMPGRIAVNVSVRQLRDVSFFDHIVTLLRESGVDPTRLELEITESAAMADMDSAVDLLTRCRNLGLCITLDDFGTHYSSLTHLQRLPVNTIKIDKSFVQGCPTDADDASIVRSIIGLGHARERRIVAEGIETMEQLAWLRAANCDFGQGFLLAKPMTETDLTHRLITDFTRKPSLESAAQFRLG